MLTREKKNEQDNFMAMRKSRQNSEFVFWDEWHFVQIDGIIGCDVGNSVKKL